MEQDDKFVYKGSVAINKSSGEEFEQGEDGKWTPTGRRLIVGKANDPFNDTTSNDDVDKQFEKLGVKVDRVEKIPVKNQNPGMGSYVPKEIPRPTSVIGAAAKSSIEKGNEKVKNAIKRLLGKK